MKDSLLRNLASLKISYTLLALLIGELIFFTAFIPEQNWRGSVFFLFLLLLFFMNLFCCTLLRIKDKKSWRNKSLAGPDFIHIGILIILFAGILSPFLKEEKHVTVEAGDSLHIPDKGNLDILSLDFHTYEDGSPRDWKVVIQNGTDQRILRINNPVRVGKLRLFLQSYQSLPRIKAILNSEVQWLYPAQGMEINGISWELVSLESEGGRWQMVLRSNEGEASVLEGESFEGIIIEEITLQDSADILLVIDPLRRFYLIAFILICSGLLLTLIARYMHPKREKLC